LLLRPPCGQPLIIAHRGYRALYPENTFLAFEHSLGRSDMIELDVRLSGDGEVVVFHDALLSRTTDVLCHRLEWDMDSLHLADWSLSQLLQLDAGSWFIESDPFGSLEAGLVSGNALQLHLPQRIPTLNQILLWCRRNNMPLNIELKDLGRATENCRLAEKVIAGIKGKGLEGMILLSSFNHRLLQYCRGLEPKISRAALQEKNHPQGLVAYLQDLEVCAYHPEEAITDQALINELRSADIAVNVFTVNDPDRQVQLARFGVSGLITDYPKRPLRQLS